MTTIPGDFLELSRRLDDWPPEMRVKMPPNIDRIMLTLSESHDDREISRLLRKIPRARTPDTEGGPGDLLVRYPYRAECGHIIVIEGRPLPVGVTSLFCTHSRCRRYHRLVEYLGPF